LLQLPIALYPEVVQLFSESKLRPQPARLFATAGPGFRRVFGISVLGKDLWVGPTVVHQLATRAVKLMKALVKSDFLGLDSATQFGDQLFMKVPELFRRYRFEISAWHFPDQRVPESNFTNHTPGAFGIDHGLT